MNSQDLSVSQKVKLLVEELDGAEQMNKALSRCNSGDSMIELLLEVSTRLNLFLTRDDLEKTPPIRDWIWWKNKQALLTLGDGTPRHQQDKSLKRRGFLGGLFRGFFE